MKVFHAKTQRIVMGLFLIEMLFACGERDLTRRANLEYADRNYLAAVELASEGLLKDPTETTLLSIRARSYIELGEGLEAIVDLSRLIELTKDSSLFTFIGHALIRLGQSEEAVKAYSNAINYDWRLNEAYIGRIQALSRLGKCQQAEKDLLEIRDRGKETFELLNSLGLCQYRKGHHWEALSLFRRSLTISDGSWVPFYNISLVHHELNNMDSALFYNNESIMRCRDSNMAFLLIERGKLFFMNNAVDSACLYWRKPEAVGDSIAKALLEKYCI